MTNKVYADGKGPSYAYTPTGKLSRRIWARGIVTDYAYDAWGSLTNTVYSDSTPTIALTYNTLGRQTEAHDAAGVTTFVYDSFGSLANETVVGVAGTNIIERFWDDYGRNVGYALNGVRQSTLAYDPVTGRLLTMVAIGSDTPFAWNYLAGSNLKSSLSYPNGLTDSWQYDANNQLLQVCNATSTNVISQYDYTYDAAGRRIACGKSGTAFTQDDSVAYGYNEKSELTNAVATVDSTYRFSYDFDEIGNREASSERGTNAVYAANLLNQYTSITDVAATPSSSQTFQPQFDDDGNQTLIKTATGVWQVTYNAENRPVRWSQGNTVITMSFDRMGRRVTKNDQRFVYNGYLQIASFEYQTSNNKLQTFVWDPTEPVTTRPLAWTHGNSVAYYTHDGNKNVSEVMASDGAIAAHYKYTPFGFVTVQRGESAMANPFRFSSEYADDALGLVYYNYRHYDPVMGRWLSRDPINEGGGKGLYLWCANNGVIRIDTIGAKFISPGKDGKCPMGCCDKKKVQLVPVWSCKRTLKWNDKTQTGKVSLHNNLFAIYHQYLCCDGENSNCYGVHEGSKKGDIIPKEKETTGTCTKRCVCPKEKLDACSGCAKMPEDYKIGPHGTDCQEWVDDVTSTKAE